MPGQVVAAAVLPCSAACLVLACAARLTRRTHAGLLVTCTVEGCQLETFQAPLTQTLRHVLARAQIDCPEAYGLTLVGDNLLTQRRVVFRGINGDLRNMQGDLLTLQDLCSAASFQVYSVEIASPPPRRRAARACKAAVARVRLPRVRRRHVRRSACAAVAEAPENRAAPVGGLTHAGQPRRRASLAQPLACLRSAGAHRRGWAPVAGLASCLAQPLAAGDPLCMLAPILLRSLPVSPAQAARNPSPVWPAQARVVPPR